MWLSSNIAQNNVYADLRTMSQNCNSDGFKTYDPTSGMLLDLCINCRAKLLFRDYAQMVGLDYYAATKDNDDSN